MGMFPSEDIESKTLLGTYELTPSETTSTASYKTITPGLDISAYDKLYVFMYYRPNTTDPRVSILDEGYINFKEVYDANLAPSSDSYQYITKFFGANDKIADLRGSWYSSQVTVRRTKNGSDPKLNDILIGWQANLSTKLYITIKVYGIK